MSASSSSDAKPPTDQLSGLVERVTFHNADSGFCVLRLNVWGERDLVTLVGHPHRDARRVRHSVGPLVADREHGRVAFGGRR